MDMKGLGKKSLVLVCGLACLLAGCTASERGRTLAEAVLTEVKAAGMDTEADENESADKKPATRRGRKAVDAELFGE